MTIVAGPLVSSAEVSPRRRRSTVRCRATSIDAQAAGGGSLRWFWSGLGEGGAEEGDLAVRLDSRLLLSLPGTRTLHVVAQDESGAESSLALDLEGGPLGFTRLHAAAGQGAERAAEAMACVESHASCVAACRVEASAGDHQASVVATCLGQCGVDLATCQRGK